MLATDDRLSFVIARMEASNQTAPAGMPRHELHPHRSDRKGLMASLRKALATLNAWRDRIRERRQLVEMNDYMLKDLGISRVEAKREWRKPFWRI